MDTTDQPVPDRDPEGAEDRPGRSGPEVGDDTGGQGAEFAGDATAAEGEVSDDDAAARLAAQGNAPTDH